MKPMTKLALQTLYRDLLRKIFQEPSPRSSADESETLLMSGPQVRVLPGAPMELEGGMELTLVAATAQLDNNQLVMIAEDSEGDTHLLRIDLAGGLRLTRDMMTGLATHADRLNTIVLEGTDDDDNVGTPAVTNGQAPVAVQLILDPEGAVVNATMPENVVLIVRDHDGAIAVYGHENAADMYMAADLS